MPTPPEPGFTVHITSRGADLDEETWVGADGSVGLAIRRGGGDRADRFGFFFVPAADAPRGVVDALTSAAAAVAGAAGTATWTDLGRTTTVEARADAASPAAGDPQGPAGRGALLAAVAAVAELAVKHPEAAVRVEASRAAIDGQSLVAVVLRAEGTESLAVSIEVDDCTILWTDGDAIRSWEPWPTPPLGLMTADGSFLDGILTPATLAPGTTAYLAIPADTADAELGVRVDLGGRFARVPFDPPGASAFRSRSAAAG